AVTLDQICGFIDCFCLSSRRPSGIDCSGLASQERENQFEAGGFGKAARLPPPWKLLRAAMSEAYLPVESGALGPEENFLSLDDILMSQEKLPVRVETSIPRLGAFFLERGAGAESDHALPQGTKLELPLWLAKGLFDTKRRILSVELPKMYQEGWRTVFSADANVVDLHKMGPHFYGFGSQLLHFDSPENVDISQSLLQQVKEMPQGCERGELAQPPTSCCTRGSGHGTLPDPVGEDSAFSEGRIWAPPTRCALGWNEKLKHGIHPPGEDGSSLHSASEAAVVQMAVSGVFVYRVKVDTWAGGDTPCPDPTGPRHSPETDLVTHLEEYCSHVNSPKTLDWKKGSVEPGIQSPTSGQNQVLSSPSGIPRGNGVMMAPQ
ncbi:hypothetical protein STEG23_028288, partial [Scotinomys teguina]